MINQLIFWQKLKSFTFLFSIFFSSYCFGIGQEQYIDSNSSKGFCISDINYVAEIYVDSNDYPGVIRAVGDLQQDINRVTGLLPKLNHIVLAPNTIIIGTIGKSTIIDRLIKGNKIDANKIADKWESFLIQTVTNPVDDVNNALIIAGSDKRGTIYGIYDLSEQIGVSPWYWWADVPIQHKDALFVKEGKYIQGPPAVKYRGIFLNDEAPSLTGWANEKFGGYNSKFYTKVFELLLRLKANYIWPAMWNNSFDTDDTNNPRLADEYGIVMGTSHHEPMMRAWKEWEWKGHKKGSWDYSKNEKIISDYWREGLARTKDYEKIITIGMRGDGDEPMSQSANIALLEKIVADQRKMISETINPDLSKVPQMWALYKEVLDYYNNGMRVPDDVTLLWCDDNWGNLRRLPTPDELKRSGGAGIYYHFDYVGGPRSYKWLNTNYIPKIWEQMNLACNYGATKIWILNVGDLKPMEFPIEFFMQLGWNPQRWPKEKISEFTKLWVNREFGPKYADEIAYIISKYTKYNARRKPELLDTKTYSLVNYREADNVIVDYNAITTKAEQIYAALPDNYKDAFFQLVLYPTKASLIINELYITAAKNQLYAKQGRAESNDLASKTRALFKADAELSRYYNHEMAKGKWNHMMDQTHIGYTSWDQPKQNIMPQLTEINVPDEANMAVAIEGSTSFWPGSSQPPVLPEFTRYALDLRYIEIFNRGQKPFEFTIKPSADWLIISSSKGVVEKERKVWLGINWSKVPKEPNEIAAGYIEITGSGSTVKIGSFKLSEPKKIDFRSFIEADGYVSIEPVHYTNKIDTREIPWEKIEDYGRTGSAMTIFPVTSPRANPPQDSPCLEYKIYFFHKGNLEVETYAAPTLNFLYGRGVQVAISFDDQPPQAITLVPQKYNAGDGNADWERTVIDSVRKVKSSHKISEPGYHTLKVWMIDPAVVIEKIVINTGGLRPSYFGPPESCRGRKSDNIESFWNTPFANGK